MKLQINKLFGKYDYDLNFDNNHKISILIGENGCGKSTILKIIKYLSNRDFISLTKIKFDSIIISDNNVSETIYHDDIKQMDVVKQYDFRRKFYNFIRNYDFSFDEITNETFNVFFDRMNKELNNNSIFVDNINEDVITHLNEDLILCGYNDENIPSICYYFKEKNSKCLYGSKYYFKYLFMLAYYIYHFEIIKTTFENYESLPLDLIKLIDDSEFFYKNLKMFLNPINEIYDFTYLTRKINPKKFYIKNTLDKLLKIMKDNQKQYHSKWNYFFDYFEYEEGRKILFVLQTICENKGFMFIKEEDETPYAFIKKLYKYMSYYYDENIEKDSNTGAFECDRYDVKILFDYILNNYKKIREDFYKNSKKLTTFISIISKYIISKNFEFDDKLELIITDKKTNNRIDSNDLSSGEKKIINLFDIVVFGKANDWGDGDKILLLDEPELSLSIYWQEMLLDDLEKFSYDKIIICTQSPNLLTEDSIKYLIEVKK